MISVKDYKNIHNGDRLFLLGNGPSLNRTPLDSLSNEYTMAMNNINLIYSDVDWRPSYYLLMQTPDDSDSTQKKVNQIEENAGNGTVCFIHDGYRNLFNNYEGDKTIFLRKKRAFDSELRRMVPKEVKGCKLDRLQKYWSDDLTNGVYLFHSMYAALQLAVYMGFDEIYLLGCDLGMKYKDPHMIFEDGNDPYRFSGSELEYIKSSHQNFGLIKSLTNALAMYLIENKLTNELISNSISATSSRHFTEKYDEKFRIWDGKKRERQITMTHVVANKVCQSRSIPIYNATLGGELDVYPRADIFDII